MATIATKRVDLLRKKAMVTEATITEKEEATVTVRVHHPSLAREREDGIGKEQVESVARRAKRAMVDSIIIPTTRIILDHNGGRDTLMRLITMTRIPAFRILTAKATILNAATRHATVTMKTRIRASW